MLGYSDHGVPGSNPSGAPFEIFIFLLPLLKNSKSGVDDQGHRLRIYNNILFITLTFFFKQAFTGLYYTVL